MTDFARTDLLVGARGQRDLWPWAALGLSLALTGYLFRESIAETYDTWMNSPEYNYGPLVPAVAALMIWRDLSRSDAAHRRRGGGWLGFAIVLVGVLFGTIEFLSHTRFPGQLGLFLSVIGLIVTWLGEGRARLVWPALVILLFAMPQAGVLQAKVTAVLQLVSSVGAVGVIRLLDIPVLREGNVIDLGQIKLQVAEACSGLRYLLPLATFAFLSAYLFVGHPVKRTIIFLSSIPITILMNMVRIAVTGLLVDRYGVAAAEGFFHDFEGWVVYCLCLIILFLEMKLLCILGGERSLVRRLDLDPPKAGGAGALRAGGSTAAAIAVLAVCVLAALGQVAIGARANPDLQRTSFAVFPREIDGWQGQEMPVDAAALAALNATDHLSLNFVQGGDVVNVWSAYYDSQYSGNAAHSPLICIPGGGWVVEDGGMVAMPGGHTASRLIISQGTDRQLVYYWFVEGGQVETNEYRAKLRLFGNAVLHNRRDGALVRFVTPVAGTDVNAAEGRLQAFIAKAAPLLDEYIPN
jgi:exosortase D (VPLPA-CTERM-specific)